MKKRKSDGGTLFDMGSATTSSNAEAIGGVEKTPEPAPVSTGGKMRLSDFVENPDNPQTITDQAFDRLLGKVERIPSGLTAKRIAYVTDHAAGKYVVLSGNKRLRALKRLHGDDAEVPAEWFQDITSMSEDQRREFIVTANVVEGRWIAKLLTSMYDKDELARLMDDAASALIAMSELGVHLSPVECACIVHHMGAFGLSEKQLREYDAALDVYPREIIATHTADILAARVDESGRF